MIPQDTHKYYTRSSSKLGLSEIRNDMEIFMVIYTYVHIIIRKLAEILIESTTSEENLIQYT